MYIWEILQKLCPVNYLNIWLPLKKSTRDIFITNATLIKYSSSPLIETASNLGESSSFESFSCLIFCWFSIVFKSAM